MTETEKHFEAPVDGRQSEAALAIARGTMRLLADLGYAALPELTLPNGRRADLLALNPAGQIWIIEIKSSVADFLSDAKWPDYLDYCDAFSFAVAPDFPRDLLPEGAGIIVADKFAAEIIAPSPRFKLAGARRKVVHVAAARAGAMRLHRLADPDAWIGSRVPT
jgi:hypothetical protein